MYTAADHDFPLLGVYSRRHRMCLQPRLHEIHVAGYMYPGRATCIQIQVETSGYVQP